MDGINSLKVTTDDQWDDSEVQVFSFDDIGANDVKLYPEITINSKVSNTFNSEYIHPSADYCCAYCASKIITFIMVENNIPFCSQDCWLKCLRTSILDIHSGKNTLWPITMYTSLEAKRNLINLACETLDGDFIIQILLSIKSRLKQDVFFGLLTENEVARSHYLIFLMEIDHVAEAKLLLLSVNSIEEALLPTYKQYMERLSYITPEDAEKLEHTLRIFAVFDTLFFLNFVYTVYRTELTSNPCLSAMHLATMQAAELLQFQKEANPEWISFRTKFETTDSKKANDVFNVLSTSLLGQNLANTLYSCILMDGTAVNGSRADILKTKYKMSDEHFRWLSIEPLVLLQKWEELNSILLEKKWLTRKTVSSLPIERLLIYLHSINAPVVVIGSFLQCISDTQSFVDIVVRLGLYEIAIEHCARKHDISTLKELFAKTPTKIKEYKIIEEYLSKSTNQW